MSDEFPSDWLLSRLDQSLDALIDYRGKTPRKTSFGVPLVTAKIIKGGRIEEPSEFIADEAFDEWMRRGLPLPGDVVMTTEAPLGEVAQLDGRKVALAQRVITLRGKAGYLDNTFLRYLMQSSFVQEQLHGRSSGTTVMGIRQSELREVMLVVPPFSEQRTIARVLSALDDKIELNRRMNRTLEELASALFRSWFVDFDPVVAKAAGRKPDHLRPKIAALFPAQFQHSALGLIPHGWIARPVTEIIEFNPTRRLAKGAPAPYLDMQNMPTDSALPQEWTIRPHGSGMKFQNGDTLVARITPCLENGKTAFVNALADDEVGWGSTEYIVMRPRPPLPLEYGYFLARSDDFRSHAIANMTGSSGRQRVGANCFEHFLVVEPTREIAVAFEQFVGPLVRMMKANVQESRTLAALRDTLLPKLLSGELRVKAAEKLVGSHA